MTAVLLCGQISFDVVNAEGATEVKFKTRLMIAFCLIAILPIILFAGIGTTFLIPQWKNMIKGYQLDDAYDGFAGASLKIAEMLADQAKTGVLEAENKNSDDFLRDDFLGRLNEDCHKKNSFIVVFVDGEMTYNGSNNESLAVINSALQAKKDEKYSIAQEYGFIYNVVNINFSGGRKGEAYVFTDLNKTLPEIKDIAYLVLVTILLILALTGVFLVFWLNRSIGRPINAIRCATQNIKDGNLDFSIKIGKDELGKLAADIDELRKRLKENAEEKVKQDEMSRQLISNISHDLKTPITTIKGYAEGLLEGVAKTPEKQKKYLQTIAVKADDMTRLIEELTSYSKMDGGGLKYNFEDIDVKDFFDDCEYDYSNELESEGIDFTYSNYAPAGARIKADPEQLRRALNNIVGNSVKYMNKNQRRIALRISEKNARIRVELEDNGCGMAAEDLPKIFDRFYRTDASRHGPAQGSGIGLAIVKKIVEDHGGKVWATSKENTGTIMHMEFPMIKEERKNEQDSYSGR